MSWGPMASVGTHHGNSRGTPREIRGSSRGTPRYAMGSRGIPLEVLRLPSVYRGFPWDVPRVPVGVHHGFPREFLGSHGNHTTMTIAGTPRPPRGCPSCPSALGVARSQLATRKRCTHSKHCLPLKQNKQIGLLCSFTLTPRK